MILSRLSDKINFNLCILNALGVIMAKTPVTQDQSFLDDYVGAGLDTITAAEQSVPYLTMVQPDSQGTEDGIEPGHWRNSATGEDYGQVVTVVPLAFRTIWSERDSQDFKTVGRYAPHSIEVTVQQPKNGKGYPKMINPETGNEVQELYVYALMLPEHPEAGVLFFNPTVGSMRACKQWNTQLKGQILPNGAQAPIFAYTWDLALDLVTNPATGKGQIAKFVKAQKGTVINKDLFEAHVKPQLAGVQQTVLSITAGPEAEDSVE